LAPGAAEAVAPYLGLPAQSICELVLELSPWPDGVRPAPRPGRDGWLIAGDPVLLDATADGLVLARGDGTPGCGVLVGWDRVRHLEALRREEPAGV
jgi:hypothetical protein